MLKRQKSSLLVDMKHPFQNLVTLLSVMQIDIDNSKNYYIDNDAIEDVINFLKERIDTPKGAPS